MCMKCLLFSINHDSLTHAWHSPFLSSAIFLFLSSIFFILFIIPPFFLVFFPSSFSLNLSISLFATQSDRHIHTHMHTRTHAHMHTHTHTHKQTQHTHALSPLTVSQFLISYFCLCFTWFFLLNSSFLFLTLCPSFSLFLCLSFLPSLPLWQVDWSVKVG